MERRRMGWAAAMAVLLTLGPWLAAQTSDAAQVKLAASSEVPSTQSSEAVSTQTPQVLGTAVATKSEQDQDRGLFGRVLVGNGHDSVLGYSSDLEFSLGYDVSHTLEFEGGIPIYTLTQSGSSSTSILGTTNDQALVGDLMLKGEWAPAIDVFDYTATVTGTLPTGTTLVTAGRGTWDINNRVEHDFDFPFNPFVEIVFGNVLPVSTRLAQNAVITGMEFQARAGNTFQFRKWVGFEAGFYEGVPLRGNAVSLAGEPPVSASDHGFTGSILASHARWEVEISYIRSLPNHIDALWTTVSYRFGHVRKESDED